MNWYRIFYWLGVADSVKSVFYAIGIIGCILIGIFLLALIVAGINDDIDYDADKVFKKIGFSLLGVTVFAWFAFAFVPSKKSALLIIAGGGTMQYLTSDSIGKQIPNEISTYVLDEIKSMAADAKVDLGIAKTKEKILEEAKSMTNAELIEKMQSDTSFANIILNQ